MMPGEQRQHLQDKSFDGKSTRKAAAVDMNTGTAN
jgi:hypothetical protein